MPIKIQNQLPALKVLESENVFVMTNDRAMTQDIRPLKILILNLMPTKVETETQLLRLLGNSPLQVDIELLQAATHVSKNTSQSHLNTFYKTFDQVKGERYDGMIITGAPWSFCPLRKSIIGMSCARLWSGARTTSIPPCISAGALRRVYIIIMGFLSIYWMKSCPACSATAYWIFTIR